MRTWRVGTFSMGAALLFLGIFLLFSHLLDFNIYQVMMSWWPAILIILGAEILVFLFVSRKENAFLKYDILSIFLVGMIGTAGIGFAILSSTGVIGKVEEVLAQEERSFELPEFSYKIDADIKRVVIRTVGYPLTVETTAERDVSIFGTYRAQTNGKEKLLASAEDYLAASKKGDTLFISIKTLPAEMGPFNSYETIAATLLVPEDMELDIIGQDGPITLKPRTLLSNWSIDKASDVSLQIAETSDINVIARDVQEVTGGDSSWKVTEKTPNDPNADNGSGYKNASYQTGSGKHKITISNAFRVSLTGGQ